MMDSSEAKLTALEAKVQQALEIALRHGRRHDDYGGDPGPHDADSKGHGHSGAIFLERATQVVAAGTTLSVTDGTPVTPFTTASGADITSTAVPFIAAGRDGQLIILRNDNGTDAAGLILSDTNYLANSNMRLDADTLTLAGTSAAGFVYSTTQVAWVFQWYKKLKHYDGAINTFTVDGASSLTHQWGDGVTANDTVPAFVATYTGIPTAASVTLTASPDAGYPLTLVTPFTSGTGAAYFRSATRNGTRTFRLSATVNGTALTADVIVTYRAPNYVGVETEPTTLNSGMINAFGNVVLDTDPYDSFAVNPSGGQYIWCAFVDGDAVPFFVIASERAGFTLKQNAFSHTSTYGKVQAYDTYRSDIADIGSVTLVTQSSDGQVRNYFGISTQAATLTAAQINALAQSQLDTDAYFAWTSIASGVSDYLWFACPATYTDPNFIEASSTERAGFTKLQSAFGHVNQYGYTLVGGYDTFRSDIIDMPTAAYTTQSALGGLRNYFGTSTQAATLTSAQILALAQSDIDTNAYDAWSSIASGVSDYLWFAYPSSYTDPYYRETSTSERAGFTVMQTAFGHVNQYGYTLAGGYDTARSNIIDMPTAAYTTTSTRPATKRYVGKVGQATQLSEAQIEALQLSDLTESPNGTFASITGLGAGDYLWFCVSDANIVAPTHYGISPGSGSSGYQEAAFTAVAVRSVTNAYGYTEDYKDIHSDVTGLQAVNINAATTTTWSMKTQAAAFANRIYMGPAVNGTDTITNAQILALDDTVDGESNLQTTVPGTYSAIKIETGEYLWFCHPDAIADLLTIKDGTTGFAIAGSYRNDVSHTNDFGITETYRCWRSDNAAIYPSGEDVVVT